jgi:hypothetical protein
MNTQSNFLSLLALIEETRSEQVKKLSKGCSTEEIESSIKINPVPDALISIYSCTSGDIDGSNYFLDLIPGYKLMSLSSINYYININEESRAKSIEQMGELGYQNFRDWELDMIPFLSDGAGSRIYVRTLPNDESVWVIPKADVSYKINTCLDLFILTAIECYQQGAYYQELDEDVWIWDTDWDLAEAIVRTIDPEIENYSPP